MCSSQGASCNIFGWESHMPSLGCSAMKRELGQTRTVHGPCIFLPWTWALFLCIALHMICLLFSVSLSHPQRMEAYVYHSLTTFPPLSLLQVITILEGISELYRRFCWGWDLRLRPPPFPSVALLCLLPLASDADLPLPCLPVWRMLQAQNHLEIIILKTNKLSSLWSLLSSHPHQPAAIFTHPSSWQVSLESHHDISCGLAWHSSKIFFQKHPALEKCQRLWCIHRDVSAEEKIHLRSPSLTRSGFGGRLTQK